jgi:Flp pilus assembly protein TadD/predicted Zn-dependent protease with MMP-like domain
MTNKLPTGRMLVLAAATALSVGCRKQHASAPAVPAAPITLAQKASAIVPTTAAAMTVSKPSDAAAKPPPQPPAAPCLVVPAGREAPLPDLLEQSGRNFERGRYEDALECAREASRIEPGRVAAHHFRGAALAELGRLDEARTAYARALALDPDDPEVLRSAADLHVRRLGGRDDLELALTYVHRAMPRAAKSKDRQLLKELHLLQAMAFDDLGRPGDALAASSRALEFDPHDREARREKGVALFELCRFSESRAELSKLAADEPDAWAEHYLGLIAERNQDDVAAAAHFAMARKLDPDAFKETAAASASVFQKVVQEEIEKLPPDIRQGLARAQFAVTDLPDVSDLVATDPPLSPGILGLFRPPGEQAAEGTKPVILLYRRNLARAAHDDAELHREVRDTIIHEVGHLNGEDDDQLRDRGL